jgi:hypothetical protein
VIAIVRVPDPAPANRAASGPEDAEPSAPAEPALAAGREPLRRRPRHIAEILDRAALVIRGTWPSAARAMLTAYLPWSILLTLPLIPGAVRRAAAEQPEPRDILQQAIWLGVYLLVDLLILRQFVRGWLFAIVGAELRGRTIPSWEAATAAIQRLPSGMIVTFVTGSLPALAIPLGAALSSGEPVLQFPALLLAPFVLLVGLPLALFGYAASAVVYLERRGPFDALLRGFRLCGENVGMTVKVALLLLLIRSMAGLTPLLLTSAGLQMIAGTALSAGLVILDVAVESVLYFTLRCRCEDYDLELLSREVAQGYSPNAAASRAPG